MRQLRNISWPVFGSDYHFVKVVGEAVSRKWLQG